MESYRERMYAQDVHLVVDGVNLRDDRGYPLSEGRLKALIGVPEKLPKDLEKNEIQVGNVELFVLSSANAKARGYFHRVFAICPQCRSSVPAGRLSQHQRRADHRVLMVRQEENEC